MAPTPFLLGLAAFFIWAEEGIADDDGGVRARFLEWWQCRPNWPAAIALLLYGGLLFFSAGLLSDIRGLLALAIGANAIFRGSHRAGLIQGLSGNSKETSSPLESDETDGENRFRLWPSLRSGVFGVLLVAGIVLLAGFFDEAGPSLRSVRLASIIGFSVSVGASRQRSGWSMMSLNTAKCIAVATAATWIPVALFDPVNPATPYIGFATFVFFTA
jgi:hypothetical protein